MSDTESESGTPDADEVWESLQHELQFNPAEENWNKAFVFSQFRNAQAEQRHREHERQRGLQMWLDLLRVSLMATLYYQFVK